MEWDASTGSTWQWMGRVLRGFTPATPHHFLAWSKKRSKKDQGCTSFAKKHCAFAKQIENSLRSNNDLFLTLSLRVFFNAHPVRPFFFHGSPLGAASRSLPGRNRLFLLSKSLLFFIQIGVRLPAFSGFCKLLKISTKDTLKNITFIFQKITFIFWNIKVIFFFIKDVLIRLLFLVSIIAWENGDFFKKMWSFEMLWKRNG